MDYKLLCSINANLKNKRRFFWIKCTNKSVHTLNNLVSLGIVGYFLKEGVESSNCIVKVNLSKKAIQKNKLIKVVNNRVEIFW